MLIEERLFLLRSTYEIFARIDSTLSKLGFKILQQGWAQRAEKDVDKANHTWRSLLLALTPSTPLLCQSHPKDGIPTLRHGEQPEAFPHSLQACPYLPCTLSSALLESRAERIQIPEGPTLSALSCHCVLLPPQACLFSSFPHLFHPGLGVTPSKKPSLTTLLPHQNR